MRREAPGLRRERKLRGEFREELVGELLGGAVDEALAELGELAADLGLDVVGQERAAILVGERDRRAALGETGNAAVAFARDAIAVGRVEIGEANFAFEARLHRADLVGRDRLELGVGKLLQRLTPGDARLERVRVVELRPYQLAGCGKLNLAVHHHGHGTLSFAPRAALVSP